MRYRSKHIETFHRVKDQYPTLNRGTKVLDEPPADIIGRDISELRRGLRNPEKANIVLLAEPGTGKTAYVQGFAYDKESLPYYLVLDVNPERLIDKETDRDNALLTGFNQLISEAGRYGREQDVIVILFIDEFHKLADISPNLLESIKPKLEKSAMNGFRLIAATTFQEYNDKIANNRALDQRFLQIKLSELPKHAVISILENRARQHGVRDLLEDGILEEVYIQSKRILISNAQPRASIDTFNSMVGDTVKQEYMKGGKLHKVYYTPEELGLASEKVICRPLLKKVIKRAHGVDIDNEVQVTDVINALKTRLFNQDKAIQEIVSHLEMAAQGFSELDRPKISFLSTGSTGTGKSLVDSELIPVPGGYKRNGDLKVGDYVYNRAGKPIQVTGVYPQGLRTVYRVTLTDGRQIDCARDHLWTYRSRSGNGAGSWKVANTEELMKKRLSVSRDGGRVDHPFVIPMNEAVQREPKDYALDPYQMGVQAALEKTEIPETYKMGSITQRWLLIRGLFDMDGWIGGSPRYSLKYFSESEPLVQDVQEILWSLGVTSTLRKQENGICALCIRVSHKDKVQFFRDAKKKEKAAEAGKLHCQKERSFDTVGIQSIEKLDYKEPMTCIMVDDPEHLYLAGKGHIVTHNTEMAKIISETMRLPLKRFDMSRYAAEADAGAFADDLFHAVWATPNAYLLIDEVEKSSRKAMNILLQVLDDARLTDSVNPDRVASFTGCIINLTTNLGSEIYQNMSRYQGADATPDSELIYRALSKSEVFETAVLGRLDAIVPFQPLPSEALEKIARRTLDDIVSAAETDKRRIIISPDVIPYIVLDRTSNDTERGGARDAKRNVKNLAGKVLAHYLTYATKEVPVILYVKGRARFRHKEIANPLNAQIALKECHPVERVDELLEALSQRVGKPLVDRGLYLPTDVDLKAYIQDIVNLSAQGYNKFRSVVDEERVCIQPVR